MYMCIHFIFYYIFVLYYYCVACCCLLALALGTCSCAIPVCTCTCTCTCSYVYGTCRYMHLFFILSVTLHCLYLCKCNDCCDGACLNEFLSSVCMCIYTVCFLVDSSVFY